MAVKWFHEPTEIFYYKCGDRGFVPGIRAAAYDVGTPCSQGEIHEVCAMKRAVGAIGDEIARKSCQLGRYTPRAQSRPGHAALQARRWSGVVDLHGVSAEGSAGAVWTAR